LERLSLKTLNHGLTAQTLVLPDEDSADLQERIDSWKDGVKSA
jgi:hypothetical protein